MGIGYLDPAFGIGAGCHTHPGQHRGIPLRKATSKQADAVGASAARFAPSIMTPNVRMGLGPSSLKVGDLWVIDCARSGERQDQV